MSDKKIEDHEMRALESGPLDELTTENEPFIAKFAPQRRSLFSGLASGFGFSRAQLSKSSGLSVMAYCISSISMTVVNKYVVSGAFWNLNFFYLAVQSVVCIATFSICKQVGLIHNLSPFDREKARRCMIYTSTKALQFLSVPVYTIFKNLTTIVIAYGEVLWFGGRVSSLALLSFGLMVLSSVVAAWADIQNAIHDGSGLSKETAAAISALNAGYAWMGLNVICTASYVLGMRKVIQRMHLTDWDTMHYNNLLTIPVLVGCSLIAEDWSSTNLSLNFPAESRNRLMIGMAYSGLVAIFISYCSAWCIRVTSSTTYSMVGALNKLPLAISGLIFFSAPITAGSVSAIMIGVGSGIVYTWAKIKQRGEPAGRLSASQPMASASSKSSRDAVNL